MLNQEITYSQARANLATMLDQVHDDRTVVIIRRENHKDVALIAEEELSSLLECVYLLRSPANAKRLFSALSWAATTEQESQSLTELREELNLEPQQKGTEGINPA